MPLWSFIPTQGREPDPGAERCGMKGVEKVLEREREPREPERNHRSSTTRALAGGASGRLREPMTAATPSPVGKHGRLAHTFLFLKVKPQNSGLSRNIALL